MDGGGKKPEIRLTDEDCGRRAQRDKPETLRMSEVKNVNPYNESKFPPLYTLNSHVMTLSYSYGNNTIKDRAIYNCTELQCFI